MKWLLANPQFIFMAIIFVVAFLANQAKAKKAREDQRRAAERRAQPPPEHDETDVSAHPFDEDDEEIEMAERTRRIQEEIRRKILERMSGRQETPPPAPQPAAPPVQRAAPAMPPPLPRVKTEKAKRDAAPAFDWGDTERQQKLAEQMRELDEKRKVAERRAKAFATAAPPAPAKAGRRARDLTRGTVSDDLRDPDSLRRAVVLREVLGPPVGSR